jgi:hypothetical protein
MGAFWNVLDRILAIRDEFDNSRAPQSPLEVTPGFQGGRLPSLLGGWSRRHSMAYATSGGSSAALKGCATRRAVIPGVSPTFSDKVLRSWMVL